MHLVNMSEDTFIFHLWTCHWLVHHVLLLFLSLHTINDTYSRHSVNLKTFFKIVSLRCTPSSCFWMRNTSNWQLTALIYISFAYYTSLHIINCVVLYHFSFFILMWNFIKKDLKTKLGFTKKWKKGRIKNSYKK